MESAIQFVMRNAEPHVRGTLLRIKERQTTYLVDKDSPDYSHRLLCEAVAAIAEAYHAEAVKSSVGHPPQVTLEELRGCAEDHEMAKRFAPELVREVARLRGEVTLRDIILGEMAMDKDCHTARSDERKAIIESLEEYTLTPRERSVNNVVYNVMWWVKFMIHKRGHIPQYRLPFDQLNERADRLEKVIAECVELAVGSNTTREKVDSLHLTREKVQVIVWTLIKAMKDQ